MLEYVKNSLLPKKKDVLVWRIFLMGPIKYNTDWANDGRLLILQNVLKK